MSDRRFPLPRTEGDPRFTVGLVLDVVDVLLRHGYPDAREGAHGRDFADLEVALHRLVYGSDPAPKIRVTHRGDDWAACLDEDSSTWEAGATRDAAVGALAIRLGLVTWVGAA